jgi:hypothetical protein
MEQNTNGKDTSRQVSGLDANEIFSKKQLDGEHLEIKELFDKELYLNAVLFIASPKGEFAVMQVDKEEDGLEATLSNGSHIVLEKVRLLLTHSNVKADDFGVFRFKTPYRIKFVQKTSGSGKQYHDVESWG